MSRSRSNDALAISEQRLVIALFASAFFVRLAYVLTRVEIPEINDMGVYDQLAMSIVNGTEYTSRLEPYFKSFRAPGYPYFLATIYWIFGHAALPVLIIQAMLSAGTCALIYAIGRDCVSRNVGILASLLCIVDAEMIHWSRNLLTETLYIFIFALLVYVCARLRHTPDHRWGALVGFLLAVGTLIRPNLLLFIPFVALYGFFCLDISFKRRLVLGATIAAVFCAVLTPWTIRNYKIHNSFVPVATIGGASLYGSVPPPEVGEGGFLETWEFLSLGLHILPNGYNMAHTLMGQPRTKTLLDPADFNEIELSNLGRDIYIDYAIQNPLAYGKLMLTKASLAFNPLPHVYPARNKEDFGFGKHDVLVRYYVCAFILVLYLVGSLGMLSTFDVRSPAIILHAVLAYHIGFQLLFRPALRYFWPGLVLCSIFTASGVVALRNWKSWRGENTKSDNIRLGIWAVLVIAVFGNSYYQLFVLRPEVIAADWSRILELLGANR